MDFTERKIEAYKCIICGNPTTKRCSICHGVYYCSLECQRRDWEKFHNKECGPCVPDCLSRNKQNIIGETILSNFFRRSRLY